MQKILQNVQLPEMIQRIKIQGRDLLECSFSEVFIFDDLNQMI